MNEKEIKYFSMFTGVGGFELGIENSSSNKGKTRSPQCIQSKGDSSNCKGNARESNKDNTKRHYNERNKTSSITYECVGFSEIDKYANQLLAKRFPNIPNFGDCTKIEADKLPDFDMLCGGFPCQSFSIAGKRKGFNDTRGTMFFEVARILKVKRPKIVLLENVKGLLSHEKGKTFSVILETLDELGYETQWMVLNSKFFGVPQNRERVFIIGHRKDTKHLNRLISWNNNDNKQRTERVYEMSQEVSKNIGVFLSNIPQEKGKELSKQQVQEMFNVLKQGIQKEECREVQDYPEKVEQESKRNIQVIEELNSWASNQDKSREVYGVVQIPTKGVLLLWSQGGESSISFRCLQQQDFSFECGQNRLKEGLRRGEFSSLLFAVQSYQGRLFYSIGNGRDWEKIYIKEVEQCNPTLSSILEENPDQKYYLSEQVVKRLMNYKDRKQVQLQQGEEQRSQTETILLKVTGRHKLK